MAIATWALFGMTFVAVVVGGFAAISAAQTYALEAEPVIVVRQRTLAEAFLATDEEKRRMQAAPLYVVTPNPTLSEGISLRPYAETDDPDYGRSGRVATPMPKPALVFAIHNIGRSPAVDITIEWEARTPIFLEKPTDLNDLKVGEQVGTGETRIAALAPQDIVYLRIENGTGNSVKLTVKPLGRQTDWRTTRRPKKTIAVVADASVFVLKSP